MTIRFRDWAEVEAVFAEAFGVPSRDRNAKRHDREAGHGPKDESANSSNPSPSHPGDK